MGRSPGRADRSSDGLRPGLHGEPAAGGLHRGDLRRGRGAATLLGAALQSRGVAVSVQSSTRSPILVWGAVAHALTFEDNYGEGIANYLYNVAPGQYDQVLACHETAPGPALYQLAGQLKARLFHFQSEDHVEEVPVR